MTIAELLAGVDYRLASERAPSGRGITSFSGLCLDSRKVNEGDLFFAISGHTHDGLKFIDQALSRGAAGVVSERCPDSELVHGKVPFFIVEDSRLALAVAADRFYGSPSEELFSVGITGTNGKTSTSWILSEALARIGLPCAQVGTLGMRVCSSDTANPLSKFIEIPNTTPDPLVLQQFLASSIKEGGARAVSMEVSSHALVDRRAEGMQWDVAVFTNITRDHLDFHGSFDSYQRAKLQLFAAQLRDSEKEKRFAVINGDDPFSETILVRCHNNGIRTVTFSVELGRAADVCLERANTLPEGTQMVANVFGSRWELNTKLIGDYNVANVLTVVAILAGAGFPRAQVIEAISGVPPVPGRLELIGHGDIRIFVDYAHTPDALVRAQSSLRALTTDSRGRLITVFGCGGNRDRGKRPLMAQAVAAHSDIAIVTSDNPRDESPSEITNEIVQGFEKEGGSFCYRVEVDRREAIRVAIELSRPGDLILIAGKGHETYQEIAGVKLPFSDVETARALLGCSGTITP